MSIQTRIAKQRGRLRVLGRLIKAYDPNEARDKGGKWTSGDMVRAYHGTADMHARRIMKEGIKPQGGRGADVWVLESADLEAVPAKTMDEVRHVINTNVGKVFFATAEQVAWDYAHIVSDHLGTEPVVLELDVPRTEFMRRARGDTAGDNVATNAYQFKGEVKPNWIRGQVSERRPPSVFAQELISISRQSKAKMGKRAKGMKLYAVVFPNKPKK